MEKPKLNFSVSTSGREQAAELKKIYLKHYPEYTKLCGFDASNSHWYFTYEKGGKLCWNNHDGTKSGLPTVIDTHYTFEEFEKIFKQPEVNNSYQIF